MTRIDKELALEMMRKGESDSKIGERFGTSRQAANLLRKAFVVEGKLEAGPIEPAGSQQIAVPAAPEPEPSKAELGPSAPPPTVSPSFDQITAWIVRLINDAAAARQLRGQLQELEVKSKGLQQEIGRLHMELDSVKKQQAASITRAGEYRQALDRIQLQGDPASQ